FYAQNPRWGCLRPAPSCRPCTALVRHRADGGPIAGQASSASVSGTRPAGPAAQGVETMPTPVEPPPAYVVGLTFIGAFGFGLVIGWVTYSTLRRAQRGGLSDIATVLGAVGGAAVTGLFPTSTGAFGAYCIGLALGFFGYLIFAWIQP